MKNRLGHNSCLNRHPLLWILGIWIASILASIFPIYAKARVIFMPSSRQLSSGHMCFFVDDIAYKSYRQSITFLIVVIITPAIIMSFCYVRIYQSVRRARITRWLNQAAQFYSTHTTIIKTEQRRANIVPKKHSVSQFPVQPNTISDREKHIIVKGLISVASQLLFWIPFGISWITSTSSGFRDDFLLQQIYIMLLAKCSVITNISHYISFNVKFRKLYIKSIIKPLKRCCCKDTGSSIGVEISHVSQIEPSLPRATGTSFNSARTIFSDNVRPSAHFAMKPIMEAEVLQKSVKKPSDHQDTIIAKFRSVSSPSKFFHSRDSTVFPLRNST